MNYLWHLLILVSIYSLLSLSLNLVVGYGGVLSLCHAAFYGLGAYAATLLVMQAGWPFIPAIAVAVAGTAICSLMIAIPSLRLRGDYLVLGTLAFQMIVFSLLYNWTEVTRGSYGIPGIPPPVIFGLSMDSLPRYLTLCLLVACTSTEGLRLLVRSPYGRLLRATRDDEVAASSLGKNVPAVRITAFAVAAAVAAVAGALFAGYMRFIDPTSFTLAESIFILSIVVIGGAGNSVGPVVGALVMILVPEALRFVNVPDNVAANLRQVVFGVLLVLMMRFRPQGILGDYGFDQGGK